MDRDIPSNLSWLYRQVRIGVTQAALKGAYNPWFERKLETTLGQEYAESGDYKKAIERHTNALSIAQKLGNSEEMADDYRSLGNIYYEAKDYEMAILCCHEFLNSARHNGREKAWAYKILGKSYKRVRQYEKAMSNFQRCLQHYKELENVQGERLDVNVELGLLYTQQENYKEAADSFRETVRIAKELKCKKIEQQNLIRLGMTHTSLNQIPEVYRCFERACQLADHLNDDEIIAEAYKQLGLLELGQGNLQNCLEHLSKSREKALKAGAIELLKFADQNMGDAYMMIRKPWEAIKHYKEFLESDENSKSEQASVRLKIGKCYLGCNDYNSAIKCFHESLNLSLKLDDKKKTQSAAHEQLGVAYYETGDYKQAQKQFHEARTIADTQNYIELQGSVDIRLGDTFCRMGNVSDGAAHYQEALEIAESLADKSMEAHAYQGLGEATYSIDPSNYQNAIDYYKKSLEIAILCNDKKRQQKVHGKLGYLYHEEGKWSDAVNNFRNSCTIAEENGDTEGVLSCKFYMGKAFYNDRKYFEAIECLKKANETSPSKKSYELIGLSYYEMKNFVKARTYFEKELSEANDAQDAPRQARAQHNIGRVNAKCGQIRNAVINYQNALEIIPKCDDCKDLETTIYCDLGHAYQADGQYEEALKSERKSLALAENTEDKLQKARAIKKIGNIFFAQKECQKAIGRYQDCLKILPIAEKATKIRVLGKLALTARSIGCYEMAIDHHKEQAEITDENEEKARALEALGTDYVLVYNYNQALECFKKFLQIAEVMNDVEKGKAFVNIARVHLLKSEFDKAIELSETAVRLGDKFVIARANSVMGRAYTGRGEYEMAIEKINQEIKNTDANDKLEIARAKGNLGKAHIGASNYDEAVDCFRDQLKLADQVQDKREKGRVNQNMGTYHAAIGEFEEAFLKYKEFLKIAKQVEDEPGICRANGFIGTIYTEMGRYQKARKCHEKERQIANKLGNKVSEGQALGNLGNAYTGLGKYKDAITLHEKSLEIAEECNVIADKRRAYENLGNVHMASGEYHKALEYQRKALAISRRYSHRTAEGRIHENMARTYYLSGKIGEALESSKQALDIADEFNDKIGKGRAFGSLGKAQMEFGKNHEALFSLSKYLKISKDLASEVDEGDALGRMAAVLVEIGNYNKAFAYGSESLKIATYHKDKARAGRAHETMGKFYMAVGKYQEAIQNHKDHLEIATTLGNKAEIGRANGNLGNVYNKKGDHKAAIEHHAKDIELAEELGNVAQVGRANGNLGNAYTKLKQFEKALSCHLKRLDIAEKLNDKSSLAKAHLGLGQHYLNMRQFENAIPHLECLEKLSRPGNLASLELTATAQQLLGQCYQYDDALKARSFFAKSIINFQEIRNSIKDFDEFNISISNQFSPVHNMLVSTLLNLEEKEAAVIASDRGKAQALFDLSRNITNSTMSLLFNSSDPMETIANPSSKGLKHLLEDSLYNVINSSHADTIISYTFGNNGELHSLVISKGEVFHKQQKIDGEKSMRNYINRRMKGSRSVQLDVTSHDDNFNNKMSNQLVLMCDEEESNQNENLADPCSRKPGLSSKSAEQTVYDDNMQDLYNVLIQPIEEQLSGSRLLIVPEGPLFTVPFNALLDPDRKHFCEKYSLQFTPSLHVLDFCLSNLPGKDLGPALFVGNCSSDLPFAEQEVVECSQYFKATPLVQRRATKKNVMDGMRTASIIHIATHGSMNRAEIHLARNDDGLPGSAENTTSNILTGEDVQNCSLKARLVVLSCCHSGCGDISAEGVVGTARSFLAAGARAVVVALWAIPDEATKEFMVEFYRQILLENSVSVALQQVMITMKRKYPSSTHWAAFQVIGENVVLTRRDIEDIRHTSTYPGKEDIM